MSEAIDLGDRVEIGDPDTSVLVEVPEGVEPAATQKAGNVVDKIVQYFKESGPPSSAELLKPILERVGVSVSAVLENTPFPDDNSSVPESIRIGCDSEEMRERVDETLCALDSTADLISFSRKSRSGTKEEEIRSAQDVFKEFRPKKKR